MENPEETFNNEVERIKQNLNYKKLHKSNQHMRYTESYDSEDLADDPFFLNNDGMNSVTFHFTTVSNADSQTINILEFCNKNRYTTKRCCGGKGFYCTKV